MYWATNARPATRAVAAALLASFIACDRPPTEPRPPLSPTGPTAIVIYDPEIDQDNTTVTADVTQQATTTLNSSEPFLDPATGQTVTSLTISPPAGSFHLELGYDYYNRVRSNDYLPDVNYDIERTLVGDASFVRVAAGSYTEYDAAGVALPATIPDGAVATSPLTPLGAFSYRSITNGVLVDTAITTEPGARLTKFSPDQGARFVKSSSGDRLDVITEITDGRAARTTSVQAGAKFAKTGTAPPKGRAGRKAMRLTRRYERRDGKYVLSEMRTEADEVSEGKQLTEVEIVTFRNVKWHINKKKDAERDSLATLLLKDSIASSMSMAASSLRTSGRQALPRSRVAQARRQFALRPQRFYECDDTSVDPDCNPGPTPPPPAPPPTPSGPPQNIIFQHGIFSNASTWDRMDPWLSARFSFGTKLKFSLPSTQPIEDQTSTLINDVTSTAPAQSGFIIVGHSQGGLIGRRAGQRAASGLITGVLTIGTPNTGALIARNGRQTLSGLVTQGLNRVAYGCRSQYDDAGCYIAYAVLNGIVSTVVNYAADATIPVSIDLQPHSYFLDHQLNPSYESFRRAGIQSYAAKRWVLMRLLGDAHANPESSGGGRAMVRYTQWTYNGFRSCQVLAIFFGDFDAYAFCGYVANRMNDVDAIWDRLTAPGDATDGIVQGASQVYPNTPGSAPPEQYTIHGGDSHLGETKSDKTRDQITTAFTRQFRVPTP